MNLSKYYRFYFCKARLDNSGMRFYYTQNLRKYDIGVITLGTDNKKTDITIPPQIEDLKFSSVCYPECTSVSNSSVKLSQLFYFNINIIKHQKKNYIDNFLCYFYKHILKFIIFSSSFPINIWKKISIKNLYLIDLKYLRWRFSGYIFFNW